MLKMPTNLYCPIKMSLACICALIMLNAATVKAAAGIALAPPPSLPLAAATTTTSAAAETDNFNRAMQFSAYPFNTDTPMVLVPYFALPSNNEIRKVTNLDDLTSNVDMEGDIDVDESDNDIDDFITNTNNEQQYRHGLYKRGCVRRNGACDHRPNDCCFNTSCRCNLWGSNCRCQRMGLFQKWG